MSSRQAIPPLGVWFGRWTSIALGLLVAFALAAPAVVQLAGLATDTTPIDNRRPAPFPALPRSLDGVAGFRDGLAQYVDDNFGLRSELVQLNQRARMALGVSPAARLVLGKDGWMFLDVDESIDQYRGLNRFTPAELDAWIDTMERYQRWLAQQGTLFAVLVAPNQQTIYPEHLPDYINRVWPETRLDQIARRLRERQSELVFVDPRPDLWAAKKDHLLYFRRESHWNAIGGFVAYSALMRQLTMLPGLKPLDLSDFTIGATEMRWLFVHETVPALKLRAPPNVIETRTLPLEGAKFAREFVGRDAAAPSVLLYADSFGDPGLLDYLRETAGTTIVVKAEDALLPDRLIKERRPSLVVYELVERGLAHPPPDNRHLGPNPLIERAPALEDLRAGATGPVAGFVDAIERRGDYVFLSGWARDGVALVPADRVYVYCGDRPIGAAHPQHRREEVAQGLFDSMIGFRIGVPEAALHCGDIRLFAVNPNGSVAAVILPVEHASPQ